MNRTLNVVRMQLVNRATFIWVPLLVLGGAFVLTVAIWLLIRGTNPAEPGGYVSGGQQAVIWYFLAVGIQSLTLTFPFSQAMSVTRREYFLGTILTAGLSALGLAAVYVGGAVIEQATGGWGLDGTYFRIPWVWDAGPATLALCVVAPSMLLFIIGFGCALVYKRFGPLWLTVLLVGVGLAFIGVLWIIGRADAWAEVATWFGSIGPEGLGAGALLATVVVAGLSFLALRRATP